MTTIQAAPDGYFHPCSSDEVAALVKQARTEKQTIRVRGSMHSVPAAILGGTTPTPPPGVMSLMLDRMRGFTITPNSDGSATVRAKAGTHLGRDPYDPTGTSTWQNSLNWALEAAGYALPDTGGITHQTVSGFLMTGSAGGTLVHGVGEALQGFEFVDGTGTIRTVTRNDSDFFALGVSMGLLGIITEVTLRVVPNYHIFGSQATFDTSDSTSPLHMFAPNDEPRSMKNFLRETPYSRLMWWPQHKFERVQIWRAARMEPIPNFPRNPYLELGKSPRVAALAGSLVYTVLGNLDDISKVPERLEEAFFPALEAYLEGSPDVDACPCLDGSARLANISGRSREDIFRFIEEGVRRELAAREPNEGTTEFGRFLRDNLGISARVTENPIWDAIVSALVKLLEYVLDKTLDWGIAQTIANAFKKALPDVLPTILGLFVALDTNGTPFWDTWRCGLPMDNQMDDRLWPTEFTELWIPLDYADETMKALRTYYRADGTASGALGATGTFSCELYAASSNPFWMSPSFGKDVLRVDLFWFARNAGSPVPFYENFWSLLKPFQFRPHWGKWLPTPSSTWHAYYRQQLPLDRFLERRAALDPDGVFATQYWREHLGF